MPDMRSTTLKLLLYVLVALALLRVVGFVAEFGEESLQMDFAAFYTAGEALNAGLSPYSNHVAATPVIWDGVDRYQHSRFLYPPLVAVLFRPVALMPYHVAKIVWMVASLVSLFASLYLALRISGAGLDDFSVPLTALAALLFYPLLTFLERGQIDSITLLLVICGVALICRKRRLGTAGMLIAVATLLKLHTLLVVPFLVLRKQWRVLVGYGAGGILIVVLSVVFCGPQALQQYATVEFPRISRFGEGGTADMLVDPAIIEALQPGEGQTVKDGRVYLRESFSFVSNASVIRLPTMQRIQSLLSSIGFPSPQTTASLLVFGVFFGLLAVLQWWGALEPSRTPQQEFLYWQLVLAIVLLSAPLTWVMNTVWLLTVVPFAIRACTAFHPTSKQVSLILIFAGLVTAGLSDRLTFALVLSPALHDSVVHGKYVLAELLVAVGLVLWLVSVSPKSRWSQGPHLRRCDVGSPQSE